MWYQYIHSDGTSVVNEGKVISLSPVRYSAKEEDVLLSILLGTRQLSARLSRMCVRLVIGGPRVRSPLGPATFFRGDDHEIRFSHSLPFNDSRSAVVI